MCVYPSDMLSQEGIPIQYLQRTSSVSSNNFTSAKETTQEEDNDSTLIEEASNVQSLFTLSHSTITNLLPEVEVPSSVIFDKVACIYTVQHNQVILTNKTRKWIQCKLITTQILLDDNEV